MRPVKVVLTLAVGLLLSACSAAAPAPSTPAASSTAEIVTAALPVTIPDLAGQDGASAREALRALGLDYIYESDSGTSVIVASNWTVLATEPQAGARVLAGSTVTIGVTKQAPTAPTPPSEGEVAPPPAHDPGPVAPPPAPEPVAPPAPSIVSYANCDAARAAGAAPIHRGEPGYSLRLDRDRDGIACE